MADEIKNAGTKAWIFSGIIIAVILIIMLIIYIYNYNFKFLPEVPL